MPNPPAFQIGQRVHFAGNPSRTGTVRYVGEVSGHTGDWVGVEWDDGDGKHDGSLNGVRYFTTIGGAASASFVRAKNLSAGISFLDALRIRYQGDSSKEEEDEMYVYSTSNRRVSVQLVRKNKIQEKLKHFDELLSGSVSFMGVGSIEPPDEINATVPNLKELDLTGNLLSNWQDIARLCEALPALEILNLTNNQLSLEVTKLPSLSSIHVLVLNNCGITWCQVEELKECLPAIQELHLMTNKLKAIDITPSLPTRTFVQGFGTLRILNLEDSCFDSWDEISKLSYLRSLEELHLSRNKLKHIYYPTTGLLGDIRPFENLCCLLLGSNELEDIASVDSMNLFPNLTDIRLSDNPIADPTKGGLPRFILIARLAKVKQLNGSEVTPRERKESEIRYVRLVVAKESDDREEVQKLHPRLAELKSLYAIEDEKASSQISGPQKMSSGFLSITLKCVGASMGEKQPMTKKLPPVTTVGKLKVLCESFFKLKDVQLRLFIQEEGSPLPQLLDDDMATLMDLGVGTGTTILVDES